MIPVVHNIRDWAECPRCKGQGKVMQTKTVTKSGLAVPLGVVPCPQCSGRKCVRIVRWPIRREGCSN